MADTIKPVDPQGSSMTAADMFSVANGGIPTMDMNRTLPRQISTGSLRGIQTVGYGNTKIDGTNNTITIAAPDGSSIGMGAIPNTSPTEYGFFSLDTNGNVIMKIVNGTMYVNRTDNTNVMQVGILPDSTAGMAVAEDGYTVTDGF